MKMVVKRIIKIEKNDIFIEYYINGYTYMSNISNELALNSFLSKKEIKELLKRLTKLEFSHTNYKLLYKIPKNKDAKKNILKLHFEFIKEVKNIKKELEEIEETKKLKNWIYKEIEFEI